MTTKTTTYLKGESVEKRWILVDAEGAVVGRLASFIAMRLRGKHRADYTPNVDCGDHVVVINADQVKFTGRKLEQKTYYWHTGYPGGVKSRTAGALLTGRFPERVLMKAVERVTADPALHTPDLGGKATTAQVTDAVCEALRQAND